MGSVGSMVIVPLCGLLDVPLGTKEWGLGGLWGFRVFLWTFASVLAGQGLLVRVAGGGGQSGGGVGEQGHRAACQTLCDASSCSRMRPACPVLGQWVPKGAAQWCHLECF